MMKMKLLIVTIIVSCSAGLLRGEDAEDSEDPANSQSITDRIISLNEKNGAPKCLEEGDILGDNCDGKASKRNAVRDRNRLWHTRIVPYYIHSSLVGTNGRESKAEKVIKEAIRDYHQYTCIRFVKVSPRSSRHKIKFHQGKGCSSKIGKTSGKQQPISLGKGCKVKGIVIHEIMHALGFWHEQSRYDRDNFVTIHWENIKRNKKGNFKKKSRLQSTTLGLPYDYDGVMHYGRRAFAIDKSKDTITPKEDGVRIGQREGFSHTDLAQLNTLYNCENHCAKRWSQWSSWSSCIYFQGIGRREQRQRFCIASNVKKCFGAGDKRVKQQRRRCGTGKTKQRRAIICQGHQRVLRCPPNYKLSITRSNYGRTSAYVCNGVDRFFSTTNCRSNVRRKVRRICQGRSSCRLHASSRVFGKPCCLTYMYLDVKYRCLRKRG